MSELIKIVVLGTTAALPSKNRLPACFAVKHGGVFLFDACEAVQQQMMRYGVSPSKLEVVFLSHLHADHFLGLFGLVQSQNLMGRQNELLIVGPRGTKEFFEKIFENRQLAPAFPIKYREATRESKVFENELFSVTAFPVKHGAPSLGYCLECHSYRRFDEGKARKAGIRGRLFTELQEKKQIELDGKKISFEDVTYIQKGNKIVYSGDTAPCEAVVKHAQEADLLVHESTFSGEEEELAKEKLHSTCEQAAETAKKAKAKKLLLIHFSNRYEERTPLLEEAKKLFHDTIIAEEGMELTV